MEAAHAPRRQVVTCWIEADASPEDQEANRAAHLKALGLSEGEVGLFVFVRWFSDKERIPPQLSDMTKGHTDVKPQATTLSQD